MNDRPGVRPSAEQGTSSRGQAFWRDALEPYTKADRRRSLRCVLTSVVPYVALFVLMVLSLRISYLLTLALAVLAAGFLVRTYIVFHDCAHGSFLASRRANRWLGAALGLLVFTPFECWKHHHAVHHATAGDLDRRGVGDLPTLTVAEYEARRWRGRLAYRLFRNPLVMFGFGPIFALVLQPRIVSRSARPRIKRSVMATNVALVALVAGLCWLMGWRDYLLVQVPTSVLAGAAGIWLFYVQHQFEDVYWEGSAGWSYADAALHGSSYLKLPKVLQFFSGNIGLHHVHHLSARIPNYNLQRAHDENPIFHDVPTLSLTDGLRATVRFKLYDPESGRMVSFAQARASSRARHERAKRGRTAGLPTFGHLAEPGTHRARFAEVAVDSPEREDRPSGRGGGRAFDGGTNGSRPGRAKRTSLAVDERSLAVDDQTASETDPTLSEADHCASEFSQGIGQRSGRQREQTAQERMRIAERRDAAAHLRDLAALARDQAADARDVAMANLEAAASQQQPTRTLIGVELVARAAEEPKRAAQHRGQAASYRLLAAEDRQAAARDRRRAARERQQAQSDREALAIELERAAVDALTGARTRAVGLRELDREVVRARRTGSPLIVVYIDVVGLKAINDLQGHAAGDALLEHVVAQVKACVRPYDLIIRLGGDEFLCVMSNLTLEAARERFDEIAAALDGASSRGAIRTGFAQLRDHETAGRLIARADSELIRSIR